MHEPAPTKIPPPTAEPTLRVGVVLEEDQRSQIALSYTKPGQVEVDQVVAGRGFHWNKTLQQRFPGTIRIQPGDGGLMAINEVPFEKYVACVVASEMGAECPAEFIKAQAVAARSWATVFLGRKHPGKPYSICNDDDCQRYQGVTHLTPAVLAAVAACAGEFLVDADGHVCPAYYSKSCGGIREDPQAIFGFAAPGCAAGPDPYCATDVVPESALPKYLGAVDERGEYYRWRERYSQDELCCHLKHQQGLSGITRAKEFIVKARGSSGRITSMDLAYKTAKGDKVLALTTQYDIRAALGLKFLKSSAIEITLKGELIEYQGRGWGHGVGLCQIGGVGMALKGKSYREILAHYYPAATVRKGYA